MFKELFTESADSNLQLTYSHGNIEERWAKDQKALKKIKAVIVDVRKKKAKANSDQGAYSWISADVYIDPAAFNNDVSKAKAFIKGLEDPNGILSKKSFETDSEVWLKVKTYSKGVFGPEFDKTVESSISKLLKKYKLDMIEVRDNADDMRIFMFKYRKISNTEIDKEFKKLYADLNKIKNDYTYKIESRS